MAKQKPKATEEHAIEPQEAEVQPLTPTPTQRYQTIFLPYLGSSQDNISKREHQPPKKETRSKNNNQTTEKEIEKVQERAYASQTQHQRKEFSNKRGQSVPRTQYVPKESKMQYQPKKQKAEVQESQQQSSTPLQEPITKPQKQDKIEEAKSPKQSKSVIFLEYFDL